VLLIVITNVSVEFHSPVYDSPSESVKLYKSLTAVLFCIPTPPGVFVSESKSRVIVSPTEYTPSKSSGSSATNALITGG